MNEEKISELLEYLASIGFKGQQLEHDIRNNIQSGDRSFRAVHDLSFAEDKVQFDLHFHLDPQFNAYRLATYTATYLTGPDGKMSRSFTPTAFGICNVNLAFHLVSGKLQDLFEKMSSLNLEAFPGTEVYPKLEEILAGNPEQFDFKCSRNEPEGFVEYIVPVSKIEGWYSIDTYKAILTPHPPIEHGSYNGINTRLLEDQMRQIDWHDDRELFIFHDDSEPEFKSQVGDIRDQIYLLTLDPVGTHIADKLQLKYWSDASFFEDSLQQSAWDYLHSLPKREQTFPAALEAKAAFNLLCGRAVLLDRVYPLPHDRPAWVRFDLTTKGPNGGYLTEVMPEFTEDKLVSVLSALPISEASFHQVIRATKRGDIVSLNLSDKKTIFLDANPEEKTINIYAEDMRPIPANLDFDPDWKPKQGQQSALQEWRKKSRQKIIHAEYPPGETNHLRRKR